MSGTVSEAIKDLKALEYSVSTMLLDYENKHCVSVERVYLDKLVNLTGKTRLLKVEIEVCLK